MTDQKVEPSNSERESEEALRSLPTDFSVQLEDEFEMAGDEWAEDEAFAGSIGRTMYDTPTSKDNTVTVLLPRENIGKVPSQSLVRIKSRPKDQEGDGRQYIGAVVEGPFAEPDGLRADAPIVITTTVRGAAFMPRYHGRVQVEIVGEEIENTVVPPRFRPLPNSPVFVLDDKETRDRLSIEGDIDIGRAVGFEDMPVHFPSDKKFVLPRHLGILGTTGGGKSTTVSGLIHQFHLAKIATIILDTEGEYTELNQPTNDERMKYLLERMNRKPEGVDKLQVYHLVGRETTASQPTPMRAFRLDFATISPYAAAEIMDLTDAQQDRFFKAYDALKLILRDLGIYPQKGNAKQEKEVLEIDEFESGYPQITLSRLIDIAGFFLNHLSGGEADPFNEEFKSEKAKGIISKRIKLVKTSSEISWKALLGKLWRLHRVKVFDNPNAKPINYDELVVPGQTTIIDLSDTQSPYLNNLVIANILRGVQLCQEQAYQQAGKSGTSPTPVTIFIEEAHEFLSREKISKMPNVFDQVARIARRGRKRWLGLVFITQLPQHLPDEVLGLINSYVLHKITDTNVLARLKRSIGGVDDSMWNKLPNLAPGQAIVSMASMARPLLVAINPTPSRLRMIE